MKLEAKGISVSFPGVKALDQVNFRVESGTICGLAGANGAGKSTLMKVLSGAISSYDGALFIDGKKVSFSSPGEARRLGIEWVPQEVDTALFPDLTVAENLFMDQFTGRKAKILFSFHGLYHQAEAVLKQLQIMISVRQKVNTLSLAEKQMLLIAKALQSSCRLLILDEPTAAFSGAETEKLFSLLRQLKRKNLGVIFISHRLPELLQLCTRLVILRNGRVSGERLVDDDCSPQWILEKMLGESPRPEKNFSGASFKSGTFQVKNLWDQQGVLKGVSLEVKKGEVVGVCGLVGAGKTELSRALFGARAIRAGEILLEGRKLRIRSPQEAVRNGLALMPEERRKEGLFLWDSLQFNLAAANLKHFSRSIFLSSGRMQANGQYYMDQLQIAASGPAQPVALLSGGNQQKTVLGKWLTADGLVYLLDEPVKGVDAGAREEIFSKIRQVAASSKYVLYFGNDPKELLPVTDRIYVLCQGRITAELLTEKTCEKEILYYAAGGDSYEA